MKKVLLSYNTRDRENGCSSRVLLMLLVVFTLLVVPSAEITAVAELIGAANRAVASWS